ncbi:MAG: class I SAM-dependent methyltransferase [Dehalococcoidia bacterium]
MHYRRIGTLDGATERDDAAYLDFVEGIKVFDHGQVEPALWDRYVVIVRDFQAQHGRPPADLAELQATLDALPVLQAHQRLFRSSQDMRAVALPETYQKRKAELVRELDEAEHRGPGRLILDPTLVYPDYFSTVEFHNQPGGYAGDPLAGYIYHYGTKMLYFGKNDNDERNQDMIDRAPLPADGRVGRILDLACAIGQSSTAWKRRIPSAEVWGIDISAPMVRYAHKRAVEMGLDVTFAQMAAERLRLPDASFDLAFANILFHEVPVDVGEQVIDEIYRVLRPGGIFVVHDVGQAVDWSPLDAYVRDFIIRDNSEPWERGWTEWDFGGSLRRAGFHSVERMVMAPGGIRPYVSANPARWVATK